MKKWLSLGFVLGSIVLGVGLFLVNSKTPQEYIVPAMLYCGLVSIFLVVLIQGFVDTQVKVVRDVEDTKFQVLEVEGIIPKSN